MKILIVDDSISKVSDLVGVIVQVDGQAEIESCRDCISAIFKMTAKFDLLLLDMLLPLRDGDELKADGGKYIIDEIYRNYKIKPPTYILCITQHDEYEKDFHPVWRTIKYNPAEVQWKETLRNLLLYQMRQQVSDDRIIIEKMPAIYLEGRVDEKIYQETFRLYFPEYIEKIRLRSEKSAGADWVTRQLVIWGSSLPRNSNGEYIKCVGIYDDDLKGREAMEQLHKTIHCNSAENKCIKSLKYSTKSARHLIPIYKKGISLPITLEEMFSIEIWKHAHSMGWTEPRSNPDMLLKDPGSWDKMRQSLSEHISSLGFSSEERLYMEKISDASKESFCNYILALEESERRKALGPISIIIKEAIGLMFNREVSETF